MKTIDVVLDTLLVLAAIAALGAVLVMCTCKNAHSYEGDVAVVVVETSTGRLCIIRDVISVSIGNPYSTTINIEPEGIVDGEEGEKGYPVDSPVGRWYIGLQPRPKQYNVKPTRALLILREALQMQEEQR